MVVRRFLVLGAFAALGGCADFGAPIGGGGGGGGGERMSPQESRQQAIETRLGELTRRVENLNLASQTQSIAKLEAEVRGLRGEVEQLRYLIETSERRSRDLYQDLDRRIQAIENEKRSAKLAIAPQMQNAPPVPASQEEEAAYLAVFDQLKAGRYDDSIAGFRELLNRYPQGRYADNAWYWMGEAYYVKRDYDAALNCFATLLERFPSSGKAPDALLKTGMAQAEKKQKDQARATWQRLIAEHPSSNAASSARQRLEQLK